MIRWSALRAVALLAVAAAAPTATAAAPPLNVLFIAVDDLRPELGTYGAPVVTPHIDRLAAGGLRFDRAYTPVATCAASRASLMTGTYPQTHGVYVMEPRLVEASPQLVTLPRIFRDAGYETVEVGKVSHTPEDTPDAWSRPRIMPDWNPPEYRSHEYAHWTGDRDPPRGPLGEGVDVPDDAYIDGRIARRAVAELERLADRPFFLAVGFIRPHLPFNCPARYWDRYRRNDIVPPEPAGDETEHRIEQHGNYELAFYSGGAHIGRAKARFLIHGYRACVSYVDAQVGLLLDALERLDLADRTLVVLWGDHGWHLGEHGIWGKNTALEPSLRIPLIVRGPGVPVGASSASFVETVDILPTLADLAGLPIPDQVEGASLAPLLEDPTRAFKRAVFGWRRRARLDGQTVRTADFRFVRWVSRGDPPGRIRAVELYDHRSDPGELRDVANDPENAATAQRLSALLDAWVAGEPAAFAGDAAVPERLGSRRRSDFDVFVDELLWPTAVIAVALALWWGLRARVARTARRLRDEESS